MTKYLLMLSFLLVSCGNSPILNHENEKASNGVASIFSQEAELSFSKTGYSFTVDWQKGPAMGEGRFLLRSWHKDQGTVSGPYQDLPYTLNIFLWMPTMGHGSSPVKITKLDNGEYDVSSVYFIMGGKWEVKIQLMKDGKVFDEVVLTYNL